MDFHIKRFAELSNHELYAILKARTDVFVVEQNCAYPELDNLDQDSLHLYFTDDEEVVAYVRLLPKGLKYNDAAAIGRVLVVKDYRSYGYARNIMGRAINYIFSDWEEGNIRIQAQVYLGDFYRSLGFEQTSEEYKEDGIPHIDMLLSRN